MKMRDMTNELRDREIHLPARRIDWIVIHCSATRETNHYSAEDLRLDHLRRGFSDAGYHYYILRDGTICYMRPLGKMGAHVKGYNKHSVGICYEGGLDAGGKPKDTRTVAQKRSLGVLLKLLQEQLPFAEVVGHRDLSPDLNGDGVISPQEWVKVCPCFDARKEYAGS